MMGPRQISRSRRWASDLGGCFSFSATSLHPHDPLVGLRIQCDRLIQTVVFACCVATSVGSESRMTSIPCSDLCRRKRPSWRWPRDPAWRRLHFHRAAVTILACSNYIVTENYIKCHSACRARGALGQAPSTSNLTDGVRTLAKCYQVAPAVPNRPMVLMFHFRLVLFRTHNFQELANCDNPPASDERDGCWVEIL